MGLKTKKYERNKPANAGLATPEAMSKASIGSLSDFGNEEQASIRIDQIAFHENNDYRAFECSEEDIERLATVIEKDGFHGSLVVVERRSTDPEQADKKYVLLGGERRLRALRMLCAKGPEMATRFATVSCTIRRNLSGNPDIARRQEMLILDGDNIHTRGGLTSIGTPEFITKVTTRYIENLMIVHGLDEMSARKLLKESTGHQSDTTIDRSVRLLKSLIPELYKYYINATFDISQTDYLTYCSFTEEEQQVLAESLKYLLDNKSALGERYEKELKNLREKAVKEIKNNVFLEKTKNVIESAVQELEEIARKDLAERRRIQKEQKTQAVMAAPKAKYLDSVNKAIKQVTKLKAKDDIKRIRYLEAQMDESESVIAKLEELEELIREIKREIGAE